MNSLFLSPHSDDAVLFGSFTLIREKPIVLTITDSYIQVNRGESITAEQRRLEDEEAMKILGCSLVFGEIRDDIIDEWFVKKLLDKFRNFEAIYAPAIQGGNPHHDLIGKVAKEMFGDRVIQYTTYSKESLYTEGKIRISPAPGEMELKNKALECYKSQINLLTTKPHFDAVRGKDEWLI
jgi:LmbE family N-acetylglucosaminyl deacetylase